MKDDEEKMASPPPLAREEEDLTKFFAVPVQREIERAASQDPIWRWKIRSKNNGT